jgi:mono/diheme cytochrome c family protein
MKIRLLIMFGILLLAIGVVLILNNSTTSEKKVTGRWYTQSMLQTGQKIFELNCASCHGIQGQGLTKNWRKPLADGFYPPPPLNGTAHAWHHPLSVLLQTIAKGGQPVGGTMPAFDEILNNEEKLSVIAWFQHWWPDKIYQVWFQQGGLDY